MSSYAMSLVEPCIKERAGTKGDGCVYVGSGGGGGVIDGESEIMFLCIFHIKQQSRFGRAVDKEYCIGW